MGTDSRAATPLPLQECKVRASILLKDLSSSDPLRSRRAVERLLVLPAFARMSPEELLASRESVRHKHALAVIAHEQGYSSWVELKSAREKEEAAPLQVDFETFFARGASVFLNHWFSSYAEALASLRAMGGYLFPYRQQFFVCASDFLASRGVDITDADWERIGRNWVEPLDPAARARLEQKLLALGFASRHPSPPSRKERPMSMDERTTSSPASRAEMKRAYKEKPPPMGVFAIRNRTNGKVLVGTSLNIHGALNRIRFELESGRHRHRTLQEDWQRQGADNFSFEVLDVLPPTEEPREDPKEELRVLELLWLERLRPYGEAGYNTPPE